MEGRFLAVNTKAQELTGYAREEAFTLQITDVVDREYLDLLRDIRTRRVAGEELPPYEVQIVAKDGRLIAVELNEHVIYQNGKPMGFQGTARDLTERQREKDDLRTRTALMQRMLSVSEPLVRPITMPEVHPAIGESALRLSGASRGTMFVRQSDGTLACSWARGVSEGYIARVIAHESELAAAAVIRGGVVDRLTLPDGRVVDGRCPFLYSDAEQLPPDSVGRRLAQSEGYRAAWVLPLFYDERATALISCYYEEPRAWSPAEQDAFGAFCRHAALALENARLAEDGVQARLELVLALANSYGGRAQRARHPRLTLPGELLGGLKALPEGAQHLVHLIDTREIKLDVDEHLAHVGLWGLRLATRAGLEPRRQHILVQAALLHDVGKLAMSLSLLRKSGILSPAERTLLIQHVTKGVALLEMLDVDERVVSIVATHHERWDGTGYPKGLAEEAIPLEARILAIADSYDAMVADRPYRKALTVDEAAAELRREAGHQFDPHLVALFVPLLSAVQ